jgi:glycosyltransferase involved in cell wall biosynthesis
VIISKGGQKKLEETVKLEIPENIEFEQDLTEKELIEELKSSDIYFQPSKWEGLCITVLEAMSCELPVVASSVGGIKDTVIHGETGYKAEPESVEEFCDYIKELSEKPERRKEFGIKGRERVKEKYSAKILKKEFEDALDSLS